jgi:hypothetical protein
MVWMFFFHKRSDNNVAPDNDAVSLLRHPRWVLPIPTSPSITLPPREGGEIPQCRWEKTFPKNPSSTPPTTPGAVTPRSHHATYFFRAQNCLQHNHNHEFSGTVLNQLFHKRQPSSFQHNTIPSLAILFTIDWSSCNWQQQCFIKRSLHCNYKHPSIIKRALQQLSRGDKAQHKQQPSNFQNYTIPSLAKLFAIDMSPFYWW